MTQAASQYAAFAKDIARSMTVFTLRDAGGYPAHMNASGERAMPFWSSLARVKKIIETVPAYANFEPEQISWAKFRDEWLPECKEEGLLIGVNWSGPRALGYDLPPDSVRERIEHYLKKLD